MIQRIQTVWMFLAVLAAVFLFITSEDVVVFETNAFMQFGCIALVLLGVFSIFSYKNRPRQIMLNNISIVINVLLIGLLVYWLTNLSGGISFPEKGIEPLFPLIAVICYLIANIFIRKDNRLVKSVDRLR